MYVIICTYCHTTQRVPLVEQELLTLQEHMSSPPVFSGVRVTRSFVLCVCVVDRCLSFFFWPLFFRAVVVVFVWQLDLPLSVQFVPIILEFVSSYPAHGDVYLMQHYVIKCVSDLRQVGGFLWVLRFPPPIELSFFFWPLCCLFFYDIRILVTPLVSSNSSVYSTEYVMIYCE